MKRITFMFILFVCLFSFIMTGMITGCQLEESDVALFMVKTTAKEIGCEVSKMPPVVDEALRDIYILASEGRLTENAVNRMTKVLNEHMGARKTTMDSFVELIILIGGSAEPGDDGNLKVLSMTGIEAKYMQAISGGYVRGFDLCRDE